MPAELPGGTVTLLFTDIEGSTRMLQELGREAYVRALTEHRRLLREAFTSHGGVEVEMQGDSFHFAFPYAREAVAAAVAGQRALAEHDWESQPIKVRIGLHTGEPMQADGLYAGLDVHWAARVMSAGHGGQVLLSQRTAELVEGQLADGVSLLDLGDHRLKDLTAPQHLFQVGEDEFPPLKTLTRRTNLPVAASPLVGREAELGELLVLIRGGARVVTVTGAGGTGKTRLVIQAAAEAAEDFHDGAVWVPLAGLQDPSLVVPSIEHALGPEGDIASRRALLVLDNFEHLLAAAAPTASLLASAPGLKAVITSRAPLHVDGEQEFPLDPLDPQAAAILFVERARATGRQVQPDDTVTEICRRLDNLPLALELAAARAKLLAPQALLQRLDHRLPLLTGGRRDAPERQQTLRATIEWSHELLDREAQQLLARLAVFAGSFSLDAAEQVCGASLGTIDALVNNSLLKPVAEDRLLMLETVREFALEQSASSGELEALRKRHGSFFLSLVKKRRAKPENRWRAGAMARSPRCGSGESPRSAVVVVRFGRRRRSGEVRRRCIPVLGDAAQPAGSGLLAPARAGARRSLPVERTRRALVRRGQARSMARRRRQRVSAARKSGGTLPHEWRRPQDGQVPEFLGDPFADGLRACGGAQPRGRRVG